MNSVKIKCPAKINLSLKVINKRPDGFHNIESVMQTVGLYDYLTIKCTQSSQTQIILSGNSDEIPYDERNLVYKSAKMFFENLNLNGVKTEIYIEKNIPVSAGLAGGSTDAAGTLYGLNLLFNNILAEEKLHELCAKLGSDLNFCLTGGRALTKGRGEVIEPCEYKEFKVSLIKPLGLGISAKEAYTKFSQKIDSGLKDRDKFENDLEWALIDDYEQLRYIKNKYPKSIMTGSGSTYFMIDNQFEPEQKYWVENDISTVGYGITIV